MLCSEFIYPNISLRCIDVGNLPATLGRTELLCLTNVIILSLNNYLN
jgi:hypothetical protein